MSRLNPGSGSLGPRRPTPAEVPNDIYTVLLLAALLALVFGTVMLGLEQYVFYGRLFGMVVDQERASEKGAWLMPGRPEDPAAPFSPPLLGLQGVEPVLT